MKQITITINLDPIKDGIQKNIEKMVSTAGRHLVIGTNYEHRIISEKEFFMIISEMKEHSRQFFIGNYMIIYDLRKAINIEGDLYLIGSFLFAKTGNTKDIFCQLSEEEVESAKESLSGYFTEIMINGDRYDALELG